MDMFTRICIIAGSALVTGGILWLLNCGRLAQALGAGAVGLVVCLNLIPKR